MFPAPFARAAAACSARFAEMRHEQPLLFFVPIHCRVYLLNASSQAAHYLSGCGAFRPERMCYHFCMSEKMPDMRKKSAIHPLRGLLFAASLATGLSGAPSTMAQNQPQPHSESSEPQKAGTKGTLEWRDDKGQWHREDLSKLKETTPDSGEVTEFEKRLLMKTLSEKIDCDPEKDAQSVLRNCMIRIAQHNLALSRLTDDPDVTPNEKSDFALRGNKLHIALGQISEAYERRFHTQDWIAKGFFSGGVFVEPVVRTWMDEMDKASQTEREKKLDLFIETIPLEEREGRGFIQGFACGRYKICKID